MLIMFPLGGLTYVYAFKWFGNWKDAVLFGISLPSLATNLLSFYFIKESPMYLWAKGPY